MNSLPLCVVFYLLNDTFWHELKEHKHRASVDARFASLHQLGQSILYTGLPLFLPLYNQRLLDRKDRVQKMLYAMQYSKLKIDALFS